VLVDTCLEKGQRALIGKVAMDNVDECPEDYRDASADAALKGTRALIDRLLLERISLAGIVRVTGVSSQWLQNYVNAKYAAQPQVTDIPVQKNGG